MINYDLKKIYEWPITAQLIVFFAVAIFVFYLGYISDINHLRNQIHTEGQQETDLKNSFVSNVSQRETLKKNILEFPKLQTTMENWKKQIATKTDIPGILDNLLKISEQDHVKFNLFDPGNEVKAGNYFKMPVKIEAAGAYDDIASFMSHVANLSKLVVIENFTITKESLSLNAEKNNNNNSSDLTMLNPSTLLNAEISLEIYRI